MVQVMSSRTSIFIKRTAAGRAVRRLTPLKILIVLTFIFVVFLYIFDVSSLRLPQFKISLFSPNEKVEEPWSWQYVLQLDHEHETQHRSYFVDEIGCRMPSFDVYNREINGYLSDENEVVCKRGLIAANEKFIWFDLNETEVQSIYKVRNVNDLKCTVHSFHRKNDEKNEYSKKSRTIRYNDAIEITDEFIRVICFDKKKKEVYRDYFSFSQNTDTEKSSSVSATKQAEQLPNVLIIGIDSVSRLNFRRRMNETYDVLANTLNAFELFGYNKVADNTFPNLIPVLTGLEDNELVGACMTSVDDTFDRCNFIWDDFKAINYTTVFAEDMSTLALFQYCRAGFTDQPTDVYLRPLIMELEKNVRSHKMGNTYSCLGSRRTVDVLLYEAKKITSSFNKRKQPHFAFFWSTSYTHDYLNAPKLIDDTFAEFFRSMKHSGDLNNTFLFVMSDHGMRYGSFRATYQGMMEERQPFLYLVPPDWFLEKYPSAMRNVAVNRYRLTNPFDLYETLRHLLEPKSLTSKALKEKEKELTETEPMPRGISLFLPVPTTRTCYDASIAPHWCTCHEKEVLSTTDLRVERVARMILDTLNHLLAHYKQCQRLYLNTIIDANIGMSNNATRKSPNDFVDITVRLQTKPGLAEFEATARLTENQMELTGSISRTNLYGKQSKCIDDYKLKLYCFCDKS